jgi:hypothetical protein
MQENDIKGGKMTLTNSSEIYIFWKKKSSGNPQEATKASQSNRQQ